MSISWPIWARISFPDKMIGLPPANMIVNLLFVWLEMLFYNIVA